MLILLPRAQAMTRWNRLLRSDWVGDSCVLIRESRPDWAYCIQCTHFKLKMIFWCTGRYREVPLEELVAAGSSVSGQRQYEFDWEHDAGGDVSHDALALSSWRSRTLHTCAFMCMWWQRPAREAQAKAWPRPAGTHGSVTMAKPLTVSS